MLFSSVIFLFYFLPIVLILYYLFKSQLAIKNGILLVFSLFFYAWGEPKFILIMLGSIIGNYILGLLVDKYRDSKTVAHILIVLMCILNLGILFIFKYVAFTLGAINGLFGMSMIVPEIALPIGISFFTFQAMSYVIDVYRRDAVVQTNIFYLALYISFFPQLIAGPIVRYETVADQILFREETFDKFSLGCCRFITGLGKKIIIANNMAAVADNIYSMNELGTMPASLAWLGSIAYTLQIFFDFSAYSDMAIGLGLMFGFKFDENFNYPYVSKSISEFWRRWHISLGEWFKSYVYFPLGGSKVSNKDTMVRNLAIVWFCTGIWHGAAWTFIIWGMLNFLFIFLERLTNYDDLNIPSWMKHIYTMLIINFGWVLFRAESLKLTSSFYASMFGADGAFWSDTTWMFLMEYGVFFIIALVLCVPIGRAMNTRIAEGGKLAMVYHVCYPIALMVMFVVSVSYLVVGSYNPFIYFNF